MAGATLAFGAAATTLGDYVDTGTGGALASPRIVIGSSAGDATAYPKDVAAAGDVAAAMAGYATTTISIPGGSTTSVSNGADIATANKKLYFRSLLNRARSTLTETDLPVVLASGTVSDLDVSGTYNFDQYINIGTKQTEYDKNSGNFDDPTLYIATGSDAKGAPFYNITIVFAKTLNVSDPNVQGGTLKIADIEYTIGSNSQSGTSGAAADSKLVLLGGAGSTVVDEASSTTVSLAGVEHTIEVSSVASSTTAVIVVDGKLKEVTEGTTYSITGDKGAVDVYVKGVYYAGTGSIGTSQVEMVLGSSKITLLDHSSAKQGTNDETIQGTHCYVVGDDSGISKIVVSVAGEDASSNYIKAGESKFDPVFGSFKVAFNGMTPALDDAARDTVLIDNSGTQYATTTITDYRGYSKQITFAYNGSSAPQLNYSSNYAIHVLEGEVVSVNEYFLIAPEQESDFGHIMQLTDMTNIDGTDPRFTLKDVLSEATMTYYFSDDGKKDASAFKTFYIDGQTYYAHNVTGTEKMNFTWGDTGAVDGDTGSKTTVFPLIRLKGGEYITYVQNQTLNTASQNISKLDGETTHILELPGGDLNISVYNTTSKSCTTLWVNGTSMGNISCTTFDMIVEYAAGQINYDVGLYVNGNASVEIKWIHPKTTYIATSNNDNLVGVMVFQEEDNATVKDAIFAGLDYASTDGLRIDHETGSRTGVSDGDSRGTNTYISDYLNTYGTQTVVTTGTESQGKVEIKYPDNQGYVTVAFGKDPTFSTGSSGGTYESAYKITQPVVLLDNEVSATSSLAYDLILLGGPCANTLVASLLADDGITCDNWTYNTGIIKEVTNAFSSGKKALIIAGTTADDTRSLAAQVLSGTMSYES